RPLVALAIPMSMLSAFSGMLRFGIAAILLSLGVIDAGLRLDSSLLMVENIIRPSAPPGVATQGRLELVGAASVEVRQRTLGGEPAGGLGHGGADAGLGVHPQVVGRRPGRWYLATARDGPAGIAPLQHAHGKNAPGGVSARGGARLEPLRHGRGRH